MARLGVLVALLCFAAAVMAMPQQPRQQSGAAVKEGKMTKEQAASIISNAAKRKSFNCIACSALVEAVDTLLKQEAPEEKIEEFLKDACISLNIEQPHVCNSIIDAFADELFFVVERVVFTPNEICGIFLDDCGTPVRNPRQIMWNITIPGNKPPVKPWPVVSNPQKTLRVLHLSDIHIDRNYTEGAEAFCKDDNWLDSYALCCRVYPDTVSVSGSKQGNAEIKVPAGKWGSNYNCDIPYRVFDNAMKNIAAAHKDLDYIIITGDLEAHDMWDYTKDKTKANIENVTAVLLQYFPNTPIYESVGNHEGVPMDAMAPHGMEEYETRGPQWLYQILADAWSNWISSDAVTDVKYRASYVVYPAPGLKLISLNTIYCSSFNFYLYIDQKDPDQTMEWLINHLLDSEAKGEKVHIISHIPAGDNYCLKGWAHNFYEVVNRFENTIAGQYYGHTHNDHFQVYYENSDPNGRPSHFNFISPSITTFSYNNPSYRIYTIDGGYQGATYTTIEAETYTTDLAVANANDAEPEWFLEYKATEAYGMKDLSPQSWQDLIKRLEQDDDLFTKFVRFYYRSDHDADCYKSADCKKGYICPLKAAKSYEEDLFCA